jgi:hypothetical protein
MDDILGPLAFALLIGGQFLAAIVLIAKRKIIYADPREHEPVRPIDEDPKASTSQHSTIAAIALARLELARRAKRSEPQRSGDASPSVRQNLQIE